MGKIIAVGGGFGGDDNYKLIYKAIELSGKEKPNFLYIPTTCFDSGNGDISQWFNLGCEVDTLRVTEDWVTEEIIAKKIRKADVIHVPGGNLRAVSEYWKKSGADKYLREAYAGGKVLYGESSGSMCWFSRGYDDCGPENAFMFVDCLGLIPYNNVPHYESRGWQEFNADAPKAGMSTIACENEIAVCFDDGKVTLIKSGARPDARVWFFDADDGYKRFDLTQNPSLLKKIGESIK